MMQTKMLGSAYPAARGVAPRVHEHFARHMGLARPEGTERLAPLAVSDTIEAMIEAAFWASLRREEIYIPRISLAFLAPGETEHPLIFEHPLPLDAAALVRLAPAVERAGIHLGVWRSRDGELQVWGTAAAIPIFCLVIEVAAPGLLVVKHHRGEETVKYVNVAVLEGDRVKVIDERASTLPDCPSLLTSLLGFERSASWVDSVNLLVQIAVSMRAHGRGGLLLVVPTASDAWLESIVRPIPYTVAPAFVHLAHLARDGAAADRRRVWRDAVGRVVEAIAGLTAVDGATVLTTTYELLAFGAKIVRRKGSAQVEQVTMTEPIEGGVPSLIHPTQLGGTRHLSAVQFVHDQRDAVALVASQDGRFTVFAWSTCEGMVHAHRIETLLM
jgi:hypothetical protein